MKNKKSVMIIAVTAAVLILVATLVTAALIYAKNKNVSNKGTEEITYRFALVREDEDITKDELYMSYDRRCFYEDATTGIGITLDEKMSDVASSMLKPLTCLKNYVEYAIEGNISGIESLKTEELKQSLKPKEGMTKQKLYDIRFTYTGSTVEEISGVNVNCWIFWMEYKIKDNNGTFRNDMGSDCTRKEYVLLVETEDGALINNLTAYKTK